MIDEGALEEGWEDFSTVILHQCLILADLWESAIVLLGSVPPNAA